MPSLPIQQILDWLQQLYNQFGYPVVFFSALIENTAITGLLLPGNSLVLLGAVFAPNWLSLAQVILYASLGTIVGYHIDYLLGRFVLKGVASWLYPSALGKRLRLAGRIRLAARFLNKYGGHAILISHLSSTLRSAIAVTAGLTHMRYRTFLFYEVIAATLWNAAFALLGYSLGKVVKNLGDIINRFGIISGIVIVVAAVVGYFIYKYVRQKQIEERRARRRAAREKKLASTGPSLDA
jgi:membrane protein DedA with SNARE-associated domain